MPTHLKVEGSSIMALCATTTTPERAGLGFITFVTKMLHPEQPERVADLNARAVIQTLTKNRSTARELLASTSSFPCTLRIGVGMGLYHCPNIKRQQTVQAGDPCMRQERARWDSSSVTALNYILPELFLRASSLKMTKLK